MKTRTVQFTVSAERGKEIDHYAQEKGFRTAADLARYATIQHMRRYPASNGKIRAQAVQPEEPTGVPEAVTKEENGL